MNLISLVDVSSRQVQNSLLTVNTVAELRNIQAKAGQRVRWLGYFNLNDGGGNTGYVTAGPLTADNGSVFLLNNGMYVRAVFESKVDPLQFGVSGSNTSADNKIRFDRMVSYCLNTKTAIEYSRSMDYQCDPVSISGASADFFSITAPRASVTHRCPSASDHAFILQGAAPVAPASYDTFQHCTVSGLRIVSSFSCIYTRYTENLVIEKCLFSGGSLGAATGVGITMSYNGPLETDIKPRIRNCIFSYCKHAILGQTAVAETDRGRVADGVFEDLVALNCGGTTGDFVYHLPYMDGAILNKVEAYQDSFNTVAANGILLQKPTLVNLTNCNMFGLGGYGIQLLSPRGVCIDSTNTIQGCGKQGNRTALVVSSLSSSITTQNVKLSPRIRECYGSAVQMQGVSNIDLSGLEEYGNCRGTSSVAGWSFLNCQGVRLHNVRADSAGTAFLNVDGGSVELFNPTFLQYTSQILLANSATVRVLPAERILQVNAATSPGGIVDEVQYDASTGSAIVTLPSASSFPGKVIRIIKTDSTSNGIGIFPAAGQSINGATSYSLTAQYSFVQLRSTGSNWLVIGKS